MIAKPRSFTVMGIAKHLLVFVIGIGLWVGANVAFETTEPWDSEFFLWVSYPLALAISAALGFAFPDLAWRWGLIIIFAQLPVMIVQSGTGPLIGVGVILLGLLSVPAMYAAMTDADLRRHFIR